MDNLGDTKRRNCEVIRTQAKRDVRDQPSRSASQHATDQPGKQYGQPKATKILAVVGKSGRFDNLGSNIETVPEQEQTDAENDQGD